MPIFDVEQDGKQYEVDAPDLNTAMSSLGGVASQPSGGSLWDKVKSYASDFAGGIARAGMNAGPGQFGTMSPQEAAANTPAGVPKADVNIPPPQNRYVGAAGEAVGNPATWIGPGSAGLKLGAGVGGALASEAAGQATEGTPYEVPARLGAGLVAGVAAAKKLGPSVPTAAVPTAADLQLAKDAGYAKIKNSDVIFNNKAVSDLGFQLEQNLVNEGAHSGGQYGTAPKTMALVDRLKATPDRGAAESYGLRGVGDALGIPTPDPYQNLVGAKDVDLLRRQLGRIAKETQPNANGRPIPTPDAQAATVAIKNIEDFMANPPPGGVVAGDVGALSNDMRQARGDYKALSQIRDVDYRANKAEVQNNRNLTGSIGQKLQQHIGSMLENPNKLRGYSPEAKALVENINSPNGSERLLRQVGRLSSYTPQVAMVDALTTGGVPLATAPYIAAAHAARMLTDSKVKREVGRLVEQIGKESPEYARRVKALPPADTVSGKAAILRALLNS